MITPQLSLDPNVMSIFQTVVSSTLIAFVALGWRLALDVNMIKTVLMNPESGLASEVKRLREDRHNTSNLLTAHGLAINAMERESGLNQTDNLVPRTEGR